MSFSLIVSGYSWASDAQIADPDFVPTVTNPTFEAGQGPVVAIDEAHNNFHTKDGRFQTFAQLLTNDGYQVISSTEDFSAQSLASIDILVIANAQHSDNVGYTNWRGVIKPAFDNSEIDALETWVKGGGSLMLMADHYPFPKAAEALGKRFGFLFSNGYCFRKDCPLLIGQPDPEHNMIKFKTEDKTLANSPIVNGPKPITQVVTFTGQAFWLMPESNAIELMILRDGTLSLYPTVADGFTLTTPVLNNAGMLQGATLELEKGRIAVFGEAGMFSAQLSATTPVFKQGMNNAEANQNLQFTLNTIHWLSMIDYDEDGVYYQSDSCLDTPKGESVDANGCSASQKDDDRDGVTNDKDKCPYTMFGDPVDSDGCMFVQLEEEDSTCFIHALNF
jgi:hypothetical protein